jgi:transposase-like protein
MNNNKHPKTLIAAIQYFAIPTNALEFFVQIRWPDGVVKCPHCGGTETSFLAKYNRWECKGKHPRRQFTVKVGSVMEDSPLGLDKWATTVWLEANAKNSISSYELHRSLGITQKSAWFMLHRIRHALHVGSFDKKLAGQIEADETFVGGRAINMHKAKRKERIHGVTGGAANMTPVMGLLERHSGDKHSTVRTMVLRDRKMNTIHEVIHKHVEPGSQLYTDALASYNGLNPTFARQFIDHAEKYVEGLVHTNGLENFWSLFKRCIKGTHVSIEPYHLTAYVDSEAFRFNNRKVGDGDRFVQAARRLHGKRLTYKALTTTLENYTADADDKIEVSGDPN